MWTPPLVVMKLLLLISLLSSSVRCSDVSEHCIEKTKFKTIFRCPIQFKSEKQNSSIKFIVDLFEIRRDRGYD